MNGKLLLICLAVLQIALAIGGSRPARANMISRLSIESAKAYKYSGNQPIDVEVRVVSDLGVPVNDADVLSMLNSGTGATRIKNIGNGYYLGCDIATTNGPAVLNFVARKAGMLSAVATAKTQPGNLCGAGESSLIVSKPLAEKIDGDKQSIDIFVEVRDEAGKPVDGAKVLARASDGITYVDAPLRSVGGGGYLACNFGQFSGKGPGAVSIHVQAYAPNFLPGQSDGKDTVGRICMEH
jgi:hypothetical protein